MARVSISEAARLAGISRGSLYKTYIKKGVISVSSDSGGKKYIDTSELLRVFGELTGGTGTQDSEQVTSDSHEQKVTDDSEQVQQLQVELATAKERLNDFREQVDDYKEREQRLLTQIDKLTDTVKLLESPKYPRLWWQFWK